MKKRTVAETRVLKKVFSLSPAKQERLRKMMIGVLSGKPPLAFGK